MKFKLEATIPTTKYGNIRPTFECDDMLESLQAEDEIERLWRKYGDKQLKVNEGDD